jgi:hypothetical protein
LSTARKKPQTEDQQTLDLIQLVTDKKALIAKANRPSYRTNLLWSYNPDNTRADGLNLNTVSDLRVLIDIVAFLKHREGHYDVTARLLEVEKPPQFKWNGYSVADWEADIKAKILKIQITSEEKKLAALEERLNKIISPELRRKMELDAIKAELK